MDGAGAPESMRVRQPRARGRGGRRASTRANPGPSRGASKNSGGTGRGGRGQNKNKRYRGSAVADSGSTGETSMFDDDDDEIVDQVASTYEFQTSEIAQGFIALNKKPDLPGFDKSAGDIWIYPTNKPVRDYQFNIVQTALFNNTLVSLPTGLGKTFIAAVVMFNFSRWYPDSLIVFMAPTRPLVAQQLDACHSLMGIPPSKMMELTGHIPPKKREEIWKEKSVLFLTPQVMCSDMARGYCPAEKVRLVVVDEAHRSQGNYSYVQAISKLIESHKCFRILGLSATPGNDTASVQEVFKNLLISRVELRSDNSPDILPYTQQRDIETVVVKLDDQSRNFHNQILDIFQRYTGKLLQQKAIPSRGATTTSQYQLIKAREIYRTVQNVPAFRKGLTELDFATAISLAHSLDLINTHGLRSFYSYLQGVMAKEKGNPQVTGELKRNTNIEEILEKLRTLLKITSDDTSMKLNATGFLTLDDNDDTSTVSVGDDVDYFISHPKFKALKEVVKKHFETYAKSNKSTRVMIFSQYRDSVQEIGSMLNTLRPLVKPMVFVGQSSGSATGRGLKQKEQIQVVKKFREGGYNLLVSTSVGEEGLDIGEVDLIVCFDCIKSPTRLIQRMGRTGRQRQGRTVFLLTSGKEESMYRASVFQSANLSKNILDTTKYDSYLYKESPRMIPSGIEPQCYKMDIILSSEQGQISNREQRKVSAGLSTSKECQAQMSNLFAKSNAAELTLTQCFKKGSEILKKRSTASAVSLANSDMPEVVHVEDEDEDDCTAVSEFYHNEVNADLVQEGWKEVDYNAIFKVFDIENGTKETGDTVVEYLRKVLPVESIEWKEEYNRIDSAELILNDQEVAQVLEEAKTEMFGDQALHYTRGLPSCRHCGDGQMVKDFQSDVTEEPGDESKDFVETGDLFADWADNVIEDKDLAEVAKFAEIAENQNHQEKNNEPNHKDKEAEDSNILDLDVGFLLDEENDDGNLDTKSRDTTSNFVEPPISPIIPTMTSRLSSQPNNKTPERWASPCQKDIEERSPVFKSYQSPGDRDLSPIITSQRFTKANLRTPERASINTFAEETSPIITSKRLIRSDLRTSEGGNGPRTDDLEDSPVFPHTPLTVVSDFSDISPASVKNLCASTPLRSQKDNYMQFHAEESQDSSDVDSDYSLELLPPTPERKSVPAVVPVTDNKIDAFRVPTPMRGFVRRYIPSPGNLASPGNTKPDIESCKQDDSKNQAKSKIFFQEKVQRNLLNPWTDELPSVSLAAALGTAPPMGSNISTKTIQVCDVTDDLDELINSQRNAVNPLSAENHLKALSRNRARDTNVPSTSTGGWTTVDRPKSKVHFESEQKPYGSLSFARQGSSKSSSRAETVNQGIGHTKGVDTRTKQRKERRARKVNPFVEDEASVSGDETSSETEGTSNSEMEEDSFVEDSNEPITESQQIRYLKSTRGTPTNICRIERPLELRPSMTLIGETEADYEDDSFCVAGDEVEYVEVGNFTQAMMKAEDQLQQEMQNQGKQKKRKAARLDSSSESPATDPRPPPAPARRNLRSRKRLFSPSPERVEKPRRKRVLEYSSEDDTSD